MIDKLDLVIKKLNSIDVKRNISEQQLKKIMNNVNFINNFYEKDKSAIYLNKLKKVKINTEKLVPLINIQIKNNYKLRLDYLKLNKVVNKKKILINSKIKNLKKEKLIEGLIEGFNIQRAIENDPTYRAMKRVYEQAINKLNQIKRQVVEKLKELKSVTEILKKVKDQLEEALYKAKDIIEEATEKINEVKEKVGKKAEKIIESSREVLNKAKSEAKIIKSGTALEIQRMIKKAKGEDDSMGLDDQDKIDKAMELIKKYDPNLASKLSKQGKADAQNTINEKEDDQSSLNNVNENADLASNADSDFGGAENLNLEGFINLKKSFSIHDLIFIIIIIYIWYLTFQKINNKL